MNIFEALSNDFCITGWWFVVIPILTLLLGVYIGYVGGGGMSE